MAADRDLDVNWYLKSYGRWAAQKQTSGREEAPALTRGAQPRDGGNCERDREDEGPKGHGTYIFPKDLGGREAVEDRTGRCPVDFDHVEILGGTL